MTIRIKNLRLRAIIGVNEWERKKRQDVILNIAIEFAPGPSIVSDQIKDTVNYKELKDAILEFVEDSRFNLLEKLVDQTADLILAADDRIERVTVEIDKPSALRFCDSVSVLATKERSQA